MRSASSALGLPATQHNAIAPRLDSLEGKTIGEVYNHHFKGGLMFGLYRQLLKQRYPGVRIVPYTELPASFVGGDSAYQRRVAQELAARAKEKGCDAQPRPPAHRGLRRPGPQSHHDPVERVCTARDQKDRHAKILRLGCIMPKDEEGY